MRSYVTVDRAKDSSSCFLHETKSWMTDRDRIIDTRRKHNPHHRPGIRIIHHEHLPRSWAKELSLGQMKTSASSTLTTHARNIVTPPIKTDLARVLHAKENDDGRDTDSSRPRSTEYVVVLGPASQVASLEPDHGHETNGYLRPDVSHVVWCIGETAVDDGDGVDLTQPFLLREGASDVVEDGGHNKADGKTDEEECVQSALAEDLMGTQGTPEDRGSKEGVVARAVKAVRCACGTNILDVDLEVEHTSTDDSGDEACHHLSPEGVARRNLGVVCELEIVQELDGVSTSDIAKGLEEVHGQSVASDPSSSNELGQDVEGNLNTSDGPNNADWDDEDETKSKTVEDGTNSGVCWPCGNTGATKGDRDAQADEVPPFRD